MKAIGLTTYGGPEVLHAVDLPDPHAGPGQVRVRVRAAGVNPADVMLRDGSLADWYRDARPPFIPGMDIAGTIDEIGPGTDPSYGLFAGQDVTGIVDNYGSHGGYSQYVVLPAASVIPKPAAASFPEAASFLMNALTAAVTLDMFGLSKGQSLVVTGAAGAYGGYVTQLAAPRRIRVIAVAAERDEQLVRSFGAAELIPRNGDAAAHVRALIPGGTDAAADGAMLQDQILPAVRDGGQITALRSWDGDHPGRGIRLCAVNVRAHATDHQTITQLQQKAEAGVLAMRVARIFPASEATAAHRVLDAGGVRGRTVLEF